MSERLTVGVAARLSRYLQVLTQAKKMGRSSISSQDVSEYTHINATQIRRDLSAFGKFGKRGVGYNIDALIAEIRGHPAHVRAAQHRARSARGGSARRSPARRSSPTTASTSSRSSTTTPRRSAPSWAASPIRSTGELERAGGRAQHHRRRHRRARRAPRRPSPISSSRPACTSSSTTPRRSCRRPADVTVHSSSPAVELLHALYFYLT